MQYSLIKEKNVHVYVYITLTLIYANMNIQYYVQCHRKKNEGK